MKLVEISLPGHSYAHIFCRPDGTTFEILTTLEDYKQLGQPNPKNPKHKDGEWIASHEFYDIPLGNYAMETAEQVQINADGRKAIIKSSLLGDGAVTPEIIAEVDKQYSK